MQLSIFTHMFLMGTHLTQTRANFGSSSSTVNNKISRFGLNSFSDLPVTSPTIGELHVHRSTALVASAQNQKLTRSQIAKELGKYIFLPDNKILIIFASLLTATQLGLNILAPYLLSRTLQLLGGSNQVTEIAGIKINRISLIITCMSMYAASRIVLNTRDQIMVYTATKTTEKLLRDIVLHLLKKDLHYHVTHSQFDKVQLIQKGFFLGNIGTRIFAHFLPVILEMSITCMWLSKKYGKEISLLMLLLITSHFLCAIFSANNTILVRDQNIKTTARMWEEFGSVISKHKIMCDYGQLDMAMSGVDLEQQKMTKTDTNVQINSLRVALWQQVASSLCIILVAIFVGQQTGVNRKYTSSDFIFIINYFFQFTNLLPVFGLALNHIIAVYPDAKFVFEKLSQREQFRDLYQNTSLIMPPDGCGPSIEFIDVSYSYPSNQYNTSSMSVLNGLSFKVSANQKIAFVSESGAGKTTIFNLLMRYLIPTSGVIKINDQDISLIGIDSVRDNINLFGQNPNLFKGTVRQNICYGAKNKKFILDEEIWRVAESVGLSDFLRSLPEHLDTNVGDAGKALSGGQQQKVAILRGLFKPSAIRLLDEVTASLDSQSAAQTLRKVNYELRNMTTLMISHKLSELEFVDQIIVLDQGRVSAQGTHNQLMSTCGLYQKLWYASLKKDSQQKVQKGFSMNSIFKGSNNINNIDSIDESDETKFTF